MLLSASRPARRVAWAILRALVGGLLALASVAVQRRRTRHQHRVGPSGAGGVHPAATRPAAYRWRVRLSTRVDGFPVTLADGEVAGPWPTADQVRAETLTRLAQATGRPTGRVYACLLLHI